MPEGDRTIPENSKENLDRKLDHAVKETFPTSDPVSVMITKGGAIDYDKDFNTITEDQAQRSSDTGDNLLGQSKETFGSAASGAAEMARGAYEQGQRYARRAAEQYPEAKRYCRQGVQTVREYAPENPLWNLLLGAAVGYGVAWMIHHERWRTGSHEQVPRYARTSEGYPFAK